MDNKGRSFFGRTCLRRKGQLKDTFRPRNGVCYDWRRASDWNDIFNTPLFSSSQSHGQMRVFQGEICSGNFCNDQGEGEFCARAEREVDAGEDKIEAIRATLQKLLREK